MKKIKIHIRNNHWKEGFLPCDLESEKHSTITKKEFEKELSHYPEIKDKIEYLVDWDEDNYLSSMEDADVLLGWQFPTENIREIAPNLKWIHVSSAGVNHLSPFDWMKKDLDIVEDHAKRIGANVQVTELVNNFYKEIQESDGGRWDASSLLKRIKD